MKIICWNVRGVSSQGSLHRLKNLVRLHKPRVVCILEPFRETDKIKELAFKIGWGGNRCAGNENIWILWDSGTKVQVENMSEQMITIKMEMAEFNTDAFISFVYASCNRRLRQELWENIGRIAEDYEENMWAVMGDFNCILRPEEKRGGNAYDLNKSREFQVCLDHAELREVNFYGNNFTWWNGRSGDQAIWVRLDRCVVNDKWETAAQTHVHHLSKSTSDHSPLLVAIEPHIRIGRKQFSFLNVWCEHEQFLGIVKKVWSEEVVGNSMYRFATKLKKTKRVLKNWNWEVFGNIFEKVKLLEERVRVCEEVLQGCVSEGNMLEYKKAQAELQKQVRIEEGFWQQKAHSQWVVDGERNSKYFHGIVRERRRKQFIHKIRGDGGQWESEQERIDEMAVHFFQRLYSEEEIQANPLVYDCLQEMVTDEENAKLIAIPSEGEIRSSAFSMSTSSAAGPDGFGEAFTKAAGT
ncbi:PREDICTED: uncharacterized protein LOC109153759 [Ipomoea nil]|uniref:uncharacterized protein LOC109153759 n=1 Tax=Ipomoea nil TaxID=35883 RepID=UPI000901310D|nr:PREDICTED: uncharacterized protein LOC109153759 [Ipomoea nil]